MHLFSQILDDVFAAETREIFEQGRGTDVLGPQALHRQRRIKWLHLTSQSERTDAIPTWLYRSRIVFDQDKRSAERGLLSRYAAALMRPDGLIASAVPVQ